MSELGIYTSILHVDIPASANAGDNVHLDVQIQNLYNYTISVRIRVIGVLDVNGNIPEVEKNMPAYDFSTFSVDFPMPAYDLDIIIYSQVWTADGYYTDAFVTARVVLGQAPPPNTWQQLSQREVAVGVPVAAGWQKLAETSVAIVKQESGWQALDTKQVTIIQGLDLTGYGLVKHADFPDSKTYSGKADQAYYFFKAPIELVPDQWLASEVASAFATAAQSNGAKMLSVDIYQRPGLLLTDFLVIAVGFKPAAVGAVQFVFTATVWAAIILAALAVLILVALTFVLIQVKEIIWGPPGKESPFGTAAILIGVGVAVVAGVIIFSSSKNKQYATA